MKNVSISGPIKDFKTNLSSFFTALLFSICKATGFLPKIGFNVCSFSASSKNGPRKSLECTTLPDPKPGVKRKHQALVKDGNAAKFIPVNLSPEALYINKGRITEVQPVNIFGFCHFFSNFIAENKYHGKNFAVVLSFIY
jgi:hypothetical protein